MSWLGGAEAAAADHGELERRVEVDGRDEKGDFFHLASSLARHVGTPVLGTVLDRILDGLDRHCVAGISDDVVLGIAEQPTGHVDRAGGR